MGIFDINLDISPSGQARKPFSRPVRRVVNVNRCPLVKPKERYLCLRHCASESKATWYDPRPGSLDYYFPEEPPRPRSLSDEPSLDAVRLKIKRLTETAKTIVGIYGRRVRFITITVKDCILDKKEFLYMLENLRKKLAKAGYKIHYSGMLERQDGKRREDKIGRMAWHLHALAYREGGKLWHDRLPNWDFSEMNIIAGEMDMNIDMEELGKAKRTTKKISDYIAKLEGVAVAAYAAKQQTGEDYVYTLTTKGCTLPKVQRIYDQRKADDFIKLGFSPKDISYRRIEGVTTTDGFLDVRYRSYEFFYYLLEDEKRARELYDSC